MSEVKSQQSYPMTHTRHGNEETLSFYCRAEPVSHYDNDKQDQTLILFQHNHVWL